MNHIYAIKNLINNKMYIGSTKSIKNRKYEHFRDLAKGRHHSPYLQKSYNKYGKDKFAFYVLEECTPENRKERELYHINLHKTFQREFGYNVYEPDDANFKCSDETKQKIRKAKSGNFIAVNLYKDGVFIGSFECIRDCAKSINGMEEALQSILKGRRKTHKGYTVTYK